MSSSVLAALQRRVVCLFVLFALLGCKGQSMVPAAHTYFEGKQLELAQLVDKADAEAVYQFAKTLSFEDLNALGKENMTVLVYAARKSMPKPEVLPVVTSLLKAGADPWLIGYKDSNFLEPTLGNAYQSRDLSLLKAALDGGVNPDAGITEDSASPMILQVSGQGGLGAIKLLVEYGADVNRRSELGRSALSRSMTTLGIEEVHYLLDHGANPNVVDSYGVSFAWLLYEQIRDPVNPQDPRLPRAYAIRDRIIKMGVAWPPLSPEQFREDYKRRYKEKYDKDFVFAPDEGYEAFVPKYVPAPVWKVPPRQGMQ